MKRYGALVVLFVAGCMAHRPLPPPHPTPEPPLVQAQPVTTSAPAPLTAPEPVSLLDSLPPDITEAMETYVRTGKAPIVDHRKEGFVVFPFGKSQPVVTCRAMSLCDIELEPGERLSGEYAVGLADPERWSVRRLDEGEGETLIQHVMIKPNDDISLQTDLILGTNRRAYHIRVVSGAKQTINAKFYYPQDSIDRFNAQQARQQQEQQPVVASGPQIDLANLHQHYQIECNGARFCPSWVADDGAQTYLLLPRGLETIGLPSVYIEQAGEQSIVNLNLSKLPYYVVDRVCDKIV